MAVKKVSDGGFLLLHCQEWGLYELSHELICSSLWPINSEDRQRREEQGAEKCNPWGITGSTQHVAVCREGLGECYGAIESTDRSD